MARAHFVGKAQKDIYERGKYRKYKSKKGKNAGQMKEVLDRTIPADSKDKVIIKKGESYYWWQFKGSNKSFSKERPKQSQLTRSAFLSQLYDIQDRLTDMRADDAESLQLELEDIKSELENLKDECQNSLDNMPEHLQESSSSGELLTQRIEGLESAIDELDGIDCEYDEPDENEIRDEAIEELQLDEDDEESLQDNETDINAAIERIKEEKLNEWLQEKFEEIQNVSIDC